MKRLSDMAEKIAEDAVPVERDYVAWKNAKIEHGLAQSKLRDTLIPIDQVWRDLKLES